MPVSLLKQKPLRAQGLMLLTQMNNLLCKEILIDSYDLPVNVLAEMERKSYRYSIVVSLNSISDPKDCEGYLLKLSVDKFSPYLLSLTLRRSIIINIF